MTHELRTATGARSDPPSSTFPLPFDPLQLAKLRIRPAAFARLAGVSRQSVMMWERKGWITVGGDGLLDPAIAFRQLIERAEPKRLRVRILKESTAHFAELQARIENLERELRDARTANESALRCAVEQEADRVIAFCSSIEDGFDDLVHASSPTEFRAKLDSLLRSHFGWGYDDAPLPAVEELDVDQITELLRRHEGQSSGLTIVHPGASQNLSTEPE